MRQEKYISEKKAYKDYAYIAKQDKLHRNRYPLQYRYHEFVKLKLVSKDAPDIVTCIYKNQPRQFILQNMDGYFYFDHVRKKRIMALFDGLTDR